MNINKITHWTIYSVAIIASVTLLPACDRINSPSTTKQNTKFGTQKLFWAIYIEEKKIGYRQLEITYGHNSEVRCKQKTVVNISKFNQTQKVVSDIESLEKIDGTAISFKETVKTDNNPVMDVHYDFSDKNITITGNSVSTRNLNRTIDRPISVVQCPYAMLLLQKKFIDSDFKSIRYNNFETSIDQLQVFTVEKLKAETIQLPNKQYKATKCKVTLTTSTVNGVFYIWIDKDGINVKGDLPVSPIRMTYMQCDEKTALSDNVSYETSNIAISSPSKIKRHYDTKSAKFTVTHPKDLVLPDTGEQTLEKLSEIQTIIYNINNYPDKKAPIRYEGNDTDILKFLAPAEFIECNNTEIIKLSQQIISDCETANDAVKKICWWCINNIKLDGNIIYATALETLHGKRADCTEMAMLIAALCRASGMPCRIISGVVYEDANDSGRFIHHVWNQVYINGKWICLDVAYGISATRIAGSISSGNVMAVVDSLCLQKIQIDSIDVKYEYPSEKTE